MSLVVIDAASHEAPYEQVRRQIAEGAASGTLPAGHKLPTVRQLATDLGLAANTVAKAYRALETDGVIETHGRGGTLIANLRLTDPEADAGARTYARLARTQGLSLDEAIRLVEQSWTP
ncbi:GntR family transcriptional regulator [Aeromicrobium sp. Root344]|uniref:GntR family transcriptional regulator n=1 Tax=Aeromicrobium sp. Root344 TaxID=1736521 RepID=UPI0006F761B9|nr:GntR family transcriptional regulator [Aeromicrobium sp. Root344]KQV74052.1 GntR family transcriptional regulator [Aeromicrobium sp. Root344]